MLVYVDNLLVYAKDNDTINTFVMQMQSEDVTLCREGTAESYLGVDIRRESNAVHLDQSGLTKWIITTLGLDKKYSAACSTPAENAPLPEDKNSKPTSGMINYTSIVGMLLYLSGHLQPDISFAVHQCAQYTFSPTKRNENALIHIGCYLKGTQDKGLILTPPKTLTLDCYLDADFAGLWNHETADNPHCICSQTEYVITLSDCPVMSIALSTMESKYIALSQVCKDLFPIMDLIAELSTILHLQVDPSSHLHVQIHKDNVGALTLGLREPQHMTLCSKHYALQYHWFREHIGLCKIVLVKIDTSDQLGYIFTKGVRTIIFQHLQKRLMGW